MSSSVMTLVTRESKRFELFPSQSNCYIFVYQKAMAQRGENLRQDLNVQVNFNGMLRRYFLNGLEQTGKKVTSSLGRFTASLINCKSCHLLDKLTNYLYAGQQDKSIKVQICSIHGEEKPKQIITEWRKVLFL